MGEQQQLMQMIRKYDFALYELQLYLDTHPNSVQALRLWKQDREMQQKLRHTYVQKFGPIQPDQSDGSMPWSWNKGPWPWEKEAN